MIEDQSINIYREIKQEKDSFTELGIDCEEKAFYDLLQACTTKYEFKCTEEKRSILAEAVKVIVTDKAKCTD